MNYKTILLLIIALLTVFMPIRCEELSDSNDGEVPNDLELDKLIEGVEKDLDGELTPEDIEKLKSIEAGEGGDQQRIDLEADANAGIDSVQDFMEELSKLLEDKEVKELLEANPDELDDNLRAQ